MPFKPLIAPEKQVSLGLGRKSMLIIGLLAGLCAINMLSSTTNLQSYINFEEVRANVVLTASGGKNESSQNHDLSSSVDVRAAERYMYNQRRALINESTVIKMSFNQTGKIGAMFFHYNFGDEIEYIGYAYEGGKAFTWKDSDEARRNDTLHRMADLSRGDLLHGQVCDVLNFFRETNGVRKHVLLSHFNENWGAFSTPVPNRTVNWGEWEMHFTNDGCNITDLYWYLNHTNVSAVFTSTHQWIDHPKVFSVPLGIKDPAMIERQIELQKEGNNRTELLLISQAFSDTRTPIANSVIANFNGTIQNRYRMAGSDYWQDLRSSKFVLCPSGMGWDTYRAWEAMCLGTIPVLETYGRKDGMYRMYDDLPVLWVENYDDVTPALLEASYPKILAKAKEYNFAKLTNQWWVDFINSFRSNLPTTGKQLDTNIRSSAEIISNQPFHMLPTLKVCNVKSHELQFDESKMVLEQIYRAYIPKNSSIAYAPWMTKCSSTSLRNAIKYSTDNAADISLDNLNEDKLDDYTFFSVLRHPLERALAGIHQLEVFWRMSWIGVPIEKFNLTWWNKTCLNSTWGPQPENYPCTGSNIETTTERRLQRLNDVLDELNVKGFWDQHIAPMTYLMSTNKVGAHSLYFDISLVDNITKIIAQAAGKEVQKVNPDSKMSRGDKNDGMDWIFRWKELVDLVPQYKLAQAAVEKLCHLYQQDIECLPYDVPECKFPNIHNASTPGQFDSMIEQ